MTIFCKENADISKIKTSFVLKGMFPKTICVCVLKQKASSFQLSSKAFQKWEIIYSTSLHLKKKPPFGVVQIHSQGKQNIFFKYQNFICRKLSNKDICTFFPTQYTNISFCLLCLLGHTAIFPYIQFKNYLRITKTKNCCIYNLQ